MKTTLDVLQVGSLRELISAVNNYNKQHPDLPIVKEDIVSIQKIDETIFLLFYR